MAMDIIQAEHLTKTYHSACVNDDILKVVVFNGCFCDTMFERIFN